jgi:hypothetical protein
VSPEWQKFSSSPILFAAWPFIEEDSPSVAARASLDDEDYNCQNQKKQQDGHYKSVNHSSHLPYEFLFLLT